MIFTTNDKGKNGPSDLDPQLDPVEVKLDTEILCGNCMTSMGRSGSRKMVCPNCKSVFEIPKEEED